MNAYRSPYLSNGHRLADVLAAIQVMGANIEASREVSAWSEKLGVPMSAESWDTIFKEHPEFFRVNDEWISLRWRHGYDRNYSVKLRQELSNAETDGLNVQEKAELTRKPLTSDQIEALMKTAIELHSRAIAQMQEQRWLMPLLFTLIGIVLGAVMQAALK